MQINYILKISVILEQQALVQISRIKRKYKKNKWFPATIKMILKISLISFKNKQFIMNNKIS